MSHGKRYVSRARDRVRAARDGGTRVDEASYVEAKRHYIEAVAAYHADRTVTNRLALAEARRKWLNTMAAPKETR